MEILGWIGALFIGLVLGLIGGGGSILTLPILVYLLGIDTVLATAYSLFVVGASALVGGVQAYKQGKVDLKTAVVFAVPAFIAVYLTRAFIVPAIPAVIANFGSFELEKSMAIMLLFAVIMLLAAFSMLRKKKDKTVVDEKLQYNYPLILIEGALVGVLTGVVGAGGGFLIIPALVLLAKLPMKQAVGTSLLIIAAKSLIGFIGDIQQYDIDWLFLVIFTSLSVVGIFIGGWLTKFIAGEKLKKGFAWFVSLMAVYIIIKELV